MPRRIPDFPDAYAFWNNISSYGSLISFVSSLFFIYIVHQIFTYENKLLNLYKFNIDIDFIPLKYKSYINNGYFNIQMFVSIPRYMYFLYFKYNEKKNCKYIYNKGFFDHCDDYS
jgi:heme/copper-type cytochrome/quinol oxidase subunit 1